MGDTPGRCRGTVAACALLLAACSHDGGAPSPEPAPSASASAAAVAVPPPVDTAALYARDRQEALTKDVQERLPYIRRAFDGGTPPARVIDDRFILVDVDAGPAHFEESVSLAQRFLAVLFDGRLYEVPTRGVTVWLFGTTKRFDEWRFERARGAPETPYGLYNPMSREIFVNIQSAGVTTLSHEMTHVILESDFPRAPVWLVEGMASLYELPDFDSEPGQIHGKVDFRRKVLLDALKNDKLAKHVRLDGLFGMNDDDFRYAEWESLNYAEAREAMRWLDAQGKLWRFYSAWRDGEIEDYDGQKAFQKVMGKTPAEATAEWIEWVKGEGANP